MRNSKHQFATSICLVLLFSTPVHLFPYDLTKRNKVSNVKIDAIKKVSGYIDPHGAVILIVGNDNAIKDITGAFEKVQQIDTSL